MALNMVEKIDDRVPVRHVLISVSDKSGLAALVTGLIAVNPDVVIISTGGTYAALDELLGPERPTGRLTAVSAYTGQPEMQGGLVKTLDFKIYLGLLSETYNAAHQADLERAGAVPIDMVVANLYPFQQAVARAEATAESARTNIDIGGPCMVRAAAKNFLRVASVTDPGDYASLTRELQDQGGCLSLATRAALARKAFAHTASYDRAIADYFAAATDASIRACYTVAGA